MATKTTKCPTCSHIFSFGAADPPRVCPSCGNPPTGPRPPPAPTFTEAPAEPSKPRLGRGAKVALGATFAFFFLIAAIVATAPPGPADRTSEAPQVTIYAENRCDSSVQVTVRLRGNGTSWSGQGTFGPGDTDWWSDVEDSEDGPVRVGQETGLSVEIRSLDGSCDHDYPYTFIRFTDREVWVTVDPFTGVSVDGVEAA